VDNFILREKLKMKILPPTNPNAKTSKWATFFILAVIGNVLAIVGLILWQTVEAANDAGILMLAGGLIIILIFSTLAWKPSNTTLKKVLTIITALWMFVAAIIFYAIMGLVGGASAALPDVKNENNNKLKQGNEESKKYNTTYQNGAAIVKDGSNKVVGSYKEGRAYDKDGKELGGYYGSDTAEKLIQDNDKKHN